ncbi:MAG: ATP-binding cassette domain-containing protein [Micromonosporaceae bacterium]
MAETAGLAARDEADREPEPVLVCRGLRRTFGDLVAVDGVGFSIGPGETYGLLGPNGAGKTTTISMVAGLLDPDAGDVVIAGRRMTTTSVGVKALCGYVPQEIAIYPDLTGRENLRFFARLYGMRGPQAHRRVEEILDRVGLTSRGGDQAKQYSGGMQRRLNIGIGLLNRPRLLILDEPTVGVDPQSRNAILESVESLARAGMAVLYTTHYMEEAQRLCDRVGIIDEGKLKAEGTSRELVAMVGEQDRVHVEASGELEAAARACAAIPGVRRAAVADSAIDVIAENGGALLPRLLETAAAAGAHVNSVEVTEPNLEAVFLHLTGRALRD